MKYFSVIILICLLLSYVPNVCAQDNQEFEQLSPQKAQNLSLFWTLGCIGTATILVAIDPEGVGGFGSLIGWSGWLFTPGLGHLYAHNSWRFWRGALIRLAGSGMIITSLVISWDEPDISGGWELFIGGSVLMVGSTIYDIVTSKKSAVEYNKKYDANNLSLAPAYYPENKALGLSLTFRF